MLWSLNWLIVGLFGVAEKQNGSMKNLSPLLPLIVVFLLIDNSGGRDQVSRGLIITKRLAVGTRSRQSKSARTITAANTTRSYQKADIYQGCLESLIGFLFWAFPATYRIPYSKMFIIKSPIWTCWLFLNHAKQSEIINQRVSEGELRCSFTSIFWPNVPI